MKKKLEHIWYYYKWYFLGALLILLPLLNFLSEKAGRVTPDYQIGLVTAEYVTEADWDTLSQFFAAHLPDRDGDGKTLVQINFYQYNGDTMSAGNTASLMASAVQLAADMEKQISDYFLTDSPQLLLEAEPSLVETNIPGLYDTIDAISTFTLLLRVRE